MAQENANQEIAEEQRARLHICLTCRRGDGTDGADASIQLAENGARLPLPGRRLFEAAAALVADEDPALAIRPVVCLANCERGCTATVSAPGKWAYMVGGLGPEHAEDLVAYGRAFAASATGAVLRGGRPKSLHHAILGRFPGQFSGLDAQVAHFIKDDTEEAAE